MGLEVQRYGRAGLTTPLIDEDKRMVWARWPGSIMEADFHKNGHQQVARSARHVLNLVNPY